jgi:hypothetical protein
MGLELRYLMPILCGGPLSEMLLRTLFALFRQGSTDYQSWGNEIQKTLEVNQNAFLSRYMGRHRFLN